MLYYLLHYDNDIISKAIYPRNLRCVLGAFLKVLSFDWKHVSKKLVVFGNSCCFTEKGCLEFVLIEPLINQLSKATDALVCPIICSKYGFEKQIIVYLFEKI